MTEEIIKETPTIPVEECRHLRMMLGDSGYFLSKAIRDIDIFCRDCGMSWNLSIETGTTDLKVKPVTVLKEWRAPDIDVIEQDLKEIVKIANAWL